MAQPPSKIAKPFRPRGNLQQFRLERPHEFECARCGQTKKSKLIVVENGDWSQFLCNGCYGYVLSRAESGTKDRA